uniref:Uncharacterized protein n=1 Tax=Arion vulgaris TaxID=1028688 RepID=A0A0B7BA39_9EUPU
MEIRTNVMRKKREGKKLHCYNHTSLSIEPTENDRVGRPLRTWKRTEATRANQAKLTTVT